MADASALATKASARAAQLRTNAADLAMVRISGQVISSRDAAERLGISVPVLRRRYRTRINRTWEGLAQ